MLPINNNISATILFVILAYLEVENFLLRKKYKKGIKTSTNEIVMNKLSEIKD